MSIAGEKLASILQADTNIILFLHNTKTKEAARNIIKNGFCFEDQLAYSTDRINPQDEIEISYFLVERKEYGDYTIIIEINKKLFKQYNRLADAADIHFEEIMTVAEPELSDNDEYIYTISPNHIKGYYNNRTGELLLNPTFDPNFDSPIYLENYNRIQDGK